MRTANGDGRMAMVMVMVTAGDDANVKVNATYEALNIVRMERWSAAS